MKMSLVFSAFVFSFLSPSAITQPIQDDTSFKTIMVSSGKDAAFDDTIDYLQSQGFFIQSVDKQAGFIQAKVFLKEKKKPFSAKAGELRTLNFVLRPGDSGTKVVLNIYSEISYFGGDISNRTYYYEDNGIMDDKAVYRDILEGLQK